MSSIKIRSRPSCTSINVFCSSLRIRWTIGGIPAAYSPSANARRGHPICSAHARFNLWSGARKWRWRVNGEARLASHWSKGRDLRTSGTIYSTRCLRLRAWGTKNLSLRLRLSRLPAKISSSGAKWGRDWRNWSSLRTRPTLSIPKRWANSSPSAAKSLPTIRWMNSPRSAKRPAYPIRPWASSEDESSNPHDNHLIIPLP